PRTRSCPGTSTSQFSRWVPDSLSSPSDPARKDSSPPPRGFPGTDSAPGGLHGPSRLVRQRGDGVLGHAHHATSADREATTVALVVHPDEVSVADMTALVYDRLADYATLPGTVS